MEPTNCVTCNYLLVGDPIGVSDKGTGTPETSDGARNPNMLPPGLQEVELLTPAGPIGRRVSARNVCVCEYSSARRYC